MPDETVTPEPPSTDIPPTSTSRATATAPSLDELLSEPAADDVNSDRPTRRRPLAALIVAGVVVLLGVVYLVDWWVTKEEIQRGTSIAGVDVGGLTTAAATERLDTELAGLAAPISMQSHGDPITLDPVSAGLTTDIDASLAAAGTRSANPFSRIGALFGTTVEVPLIATVDDAALTRQLQAVAATSDVAAVEGNVALEGTTAVVVQPVVGEQLDLAGAATLISDAWTGGDPTSANGLTLPVTEQPVRAAADKVTRTGAELTALLSGPLTVAAGDTPIPVPLETIAAAVSVVPDDADGFTLTVDEAALKAAYQAPVEATQGAATDASIAIVDNAPVITPGVDGRSVDWAATDAALAAALRAPDHLLTVTYALTPPALTTEAVQALGIKEVISEFTTRGFATDSGKNVRRAAEEVQGAIVLPGATFSLNGYTGVRNADSGYVEAGIIDNGVASRGIAGGVSQFATTLYNAGFFSGMQDIEHKPHSYYISRYPPGRESTVFTTDDGSSLIDVKFKNTSATGIVIQTIWTPDSITVKFWGTKTVEVESLSSDRYNITGAPTRTIPYGETCKATNGSSGFTVDVTRVIRDLTGVEQSRETKTTVYNGQVKITCAPPPVVVTPPADPTTPPAAAPGG